MINHQLSNPYKDSKTENSQSIESLTDFTLMLREKVSQRYTEGDFDTASQFLFQIQKILRFEEHKRRNV